MSSSSLEIQVPEVQSVEINRSTLTFVLKDGRAVSAPIAWYPRLQEGTDRERKNWELIGAGYGVHWPDLDEDISVENLLQGQRSRESERSLRAWREQRSNRRRGNGRDS